MVCGVCGASYPADVRYCAVDGSLLRPAGAQDELVGKVIDDRYYVLSKLGEGGMGNVYLGEHVRTRRRCAVKVISRLHASDPEALRRFLREATNAGRINHPYVATLYDFGETGDGVAYLAMEYVEGEPLSALLAREGALPPARAVEIARQVAEGVAAAHDLGIVHRDLKPGNVLITHDRRGGDLVKVVDFGIARAPADEEQNLTRTGIVIGTPEYMSPEQLIGDPVDGRSDVYSLGCILYQMLTGEQPFAGTAAQMITRRLTEQPPRPREKNPEIPKPLDELIVTALGRLPTERYQTMEALRDALLAAPAQPVSTGPRRLAAWFGKRAQREPDSPPVTGPRTQPRTGGGASTGGRVHTGGGAHTGGSVHTGGTPAWSEELHATGALETASPAPASGETELASIDAAVEPVEESTEAAVETSPTGPDTGSDEPYSLDAEYVAPPVEGERRLPVRAIAAGVALVALVITGFALVSGGDGDPQPVETPPAIVAPPPPSAPDAATMLGLWEGYLTAIAESDSAQYDAALSGLRATEQRAGELLATFPADPGLETVSRYAREQLLVTTELCQSLRDLLLGRPNTTPPVCNPDAQPQDSLVTSASDSSIPPESRQERP